MSGVRNTLRALIYTYLIVSGLLMLGWAGFAGVYLGLQHNPSAVYCDYDVPPEKTNFTNESGESCRMRAWVFIESGLIGLIVLVSIQWPAYLFFFVGFVSRWHVKRKLAALDEPS